LVASMVETRNSGQCAKRWNDTLNPEIDRSAWSSEEDAKLLDAVNTHGTSWTTIVKSYFPGRTALAAKNRYSHLSRSSHSRRDSSPSSSSSSADGSDMSSTMDGSRSNGDSASSSAEEGSKSDISILNCMDPMDFLLSEPATPASLSSSSPSPSSPPLTPLEASASKTANNIQMLERFLNGLGSNSDSDSESKFGDFSFPDQILSCPDAGPMVQDLFNPSLDSFSTCSSASSLPDISCLDDSAFQLDAEQISSLWPQADDFAVSSMDILAHGSTSDPISPNLTSNDKIPTASPDASQSYLRSDQQIAVAVAICHPHNLRPTIQILVQSLAGAFAQPVSPSPSSSSSSKT